MVTLMTDENNEYSIELHRGGPDNPLAAIIRHRYGGLVCYFGSHEGRNGSEHTFSASTDTHPMW